MKKKQSLELPTEYNEYIKHLYSSVSPVWVLLSPNEKFEFAAYLWSLGSDHDYHPRSNILYKTKAYDAQKTPMDQRVYPQSTVFGKKRFRTNHNQYISKGFHFYKTNLEDAMLKVKEQHGGRFFAPDLMRFLNHVWSHGSIHNYHASAKPLYGPNAYQQRRLR